MGFTWRQRFEQFLQARLVLVTFWALTSWLDPFGVLGPQVFVNLVLELCVGVDLVRHGD